MGSTAMNLGVSNLLQMLSNLNSPVLSSPAVASALEDAPSSDIVQLSSEATQLEGVEAMFGIQPGSDDSSGSLTSMLANLESSLTGSAPSSTGTSSTPDLSTAAGVAQLAGYQAAMQSEEALALLGYGTGNTSSTLFDLSG
jgi:hypothetical protein